MESLRILNMVVHSVGVVTIQKALKLKHRQTVYSWRKYGLPWHSMLEYAEEIALVAHPDDSVARRALATALAVESADFKKSTIRGVWHKA